MRWLPGVLYAGSAGFGLIYGAYIEANEVESSWWLSFMLPDGNAAVLLVIALALFASSVILVERRDKRAAAAGDAATPSRGMLRIPRDQTYELVDGMHVGKSITSRRRVTWPSGGHIGWFEANDFGGWIVRDVTGNSVGDAPDLPGAVALLRGRLAAQ